MGLHAWFEFVDRAVLWALAPLALAILMSGLDDLVIDVVWAADWLRNRFRPEADLFPPGPRQLDSAPIRRIAILIPLWHEHQVIARMIEHAIATIHYPDFHIFAGAYPNDDLTQDAIRRVADRFPTVHLVLCPHDGPTSKADCLNWIYQHLGLYEEQNGERFHVVVTHDAEDLIHPDELRWINYYSARFDFVQTPVLALPTPFRAMTHGIYCDEFAEYHTRDMPVRTLLGGFLPSAGVGTGYRRSALEKLAETNSNRVFEPEALTEDYENGLKLFRMGCSQAFVPISRVAGPRNFVATREYFPQNWSSALRQRTRWVMGIALQGWERHGWGRNPGETYWLWRDRKGLIANPLGLAANVVFVYGLATAIWARVPPLATRVVYATAALQILRLAVRMTCSARIYGFRFALGVPLRAAYANLLNSAATLLALTRYALARIRGQALVWMKTDHSFPSRATLQAHSSQTLSRKLGEILVSSGYLTTAALRVALATKPPDLRLGEHLVRIRQIDEASLYDGLSLQKGLPLTDPDPSEIPPRVARALPEHVVRQWNALPFRVAEGALDLAVADVPSHAMSAALRPFTTLELRFHLVTPGKFRKLAKALL
ncbi:MAG TPA: glycosyl transferase family protein [Bryobacteraceae bacterium]|nr:glycosyl transferase family protein [Bryobacteraceae bacterium]